MRYHYISDSHVHSDCSFDGTDPVMMICERAAALGLYSIAVTDHCECDIYYKEGFDRSVVQSFLRPERPGRCFTAGFRYTPEHRAGPAHHRSESDPGGLVRHRLRFCAGFGT